MAESGFTDSPHVNEGTLHAWLDGALSADEANTVELHVAACDTCSAAAAEARGLIAASTRILTALDDVPRGVIPDNVPTTHTRFGATAPARGRVRSMRRLRSYAPFAAVALFAIAATLVLRPGASPVRHPVTSAAEPAARPTDVAHDEPKTQVAPAPGERSRAGRVDTRPSQAAPSSAGRVAAASDHAVDAADAEVSGRTSRSTAAKSQAAESSLPGAVAAGAVSSHSDDSVAVTERATVAASPTQMDIAADRRANGSFASPRTSAAQSEGMSTGVAKPRTDEFTEPPPTMAGARVVSSTVRDEGYSRVRRTMYQVDSGATVTLVEYGSRRAASVAAPVRQADTSFPAARVMLRAPSSAANSVMWMASDGTLRFLSGMLPEAELEALKKRIVP